MQNIIKEILEAEKFTEMNIAKAENDKQKIIEDARRSSLSMISQEKEKINKERESKIRAAKETILKKKGKILFEGKKEADLLEMSASKNIKKAEKFLLEEFYKKVEGQPDA